MPFTLLNTIAPGSLSSPIARLSSATDAAGSHNGNVASAAKRGDRSRTVGLDQQTAALLARWVDRRRVCAQAAGPALAPIFCNLQRGRIDTSYVRRLLPRLAGKAGVNKRVHAHGLRRAHAAGLAREGTPINIIRDDLGHSSLAVTDRYLRDVAPKP